jgi:hypothetical protein
MSASFDAFMPQDTGPQGREMGTHLVPPFRSQIKLCPLFQCRGWGTDLVPPYMSQIYSQQLSLHEQAAKRESLSALALAISTPRYEALAISTPQLQSPRHQHSQIQGPSHQHFQVQGVDVSTPRHGALAINTPRYRSPRVTPRPPK